MTNRELEVIGIVKNCLTLEEAMAKLKASGEKVSKSTFSVSFGDNFDESVSQFNYHNELKWIYHNGKNCSTCRERATRRY